MNDYLFKGYHFSNISLGGNAEFFFDAGYIDIGNCPEVKAHWEIQRADGETEMYTVLNKTHPIGTYDDFPDRGISFNGFCFPSGNSCYLIIHMTVNPTDLRYNGTQITGVLNLPECFNSSNITDPMTLNIQGIHYHALFSRPSIRLLYLEYYYELRED